MEEKEITKNQLITIGLILFFALILRLYLSQFGGYEHDIGDFTNWSNEAYNNGFSNFYENTGADYPPFYIYILWILGAINNSISVDINLLLKIPAIIADIATAFLIFIIAIKYTSHKIALTSMLFYVFNPAIIFNSAIWGQVDSIYVFFLIFATKEYISDRPVSSSIFLTLSILTKPQSFVLIPVFILLGYKKYGLKVLGIASCVSFTSFLLLTRPFYDDVSNIFRLYLSSYTQYAFTSMNAYNLWALAGMFKPDSTLFISLSYRMWGYILFGMLFLGTIYILLKKKEEKLIFSASALLFFGFFIFSTRMHERYLFPIFAFLVIAMIFDKRLKIIYIISSITFFINLYIVFTEVETGIPIPISMFIIPYVIGINIVMFIYLGYYFYTQRIRT